jgi:hypothetical protein
MEKVNTEANALVMKDTAPSTLSPEFQSLFTALTTKLSSLLITGQAPNVAVILIIVIESTMTVVEAYNQSGGTMTGPEKKALALSLVTLVINDLATSGKIPTALAASLNEDVTLWGGVVIDVAVDAANATFAIGQKAVTQIEAFETDVKTTGCKAACGKDCCCIC